MRRSHIIVLAVVLAVVLVSAGGLVAYDGSRSDTIAKGIKVGVVDVGGLSADVARTKLRTAMLAKLQRPLVVVAGETRFALSAREARIEANIDGMVDDAVKRGREGGIFARTWRGLTGGEVKTSLTPQVAYSEPAVRRLVDKVRVQMTRKPVDADITVSGEKVKVRKAVTGLAVHAKHLRLKVEQALVSDIVGERAVRADLRTVKPKVSNERLAKKYPVVLTVDRSNFRLSLFRKLRKVKTYPIAVGAAGLETPVGRYSITNKAVNPAWSVPNSPWAGSLAGTVVPGGIASNPLKARWLGVYDGVGVHGTSDRASIGQNASKGCIRMLIEDVIKLYDQVPVGTPIFIS